MRSLLDAAACGPTSAVSTSYGSCSITSRRFPLKSLSGQRQPCLGLLRQRGDATGLPSNERLLRLRPLRALDDRPAADVAPPPAPTAPALHASPLPASSQTTTTATTTTAASEPAAAAPLANPPGGPPTTTTTAPTGAADVDASAAADLNTMWEGIKRDMRKELSPQEAEVLESIKVDDLLGNNGDLMRKIADEQLGPLLQSLGVSEEPLAFFVDLLRLATGLQLLSAGGLFYGAELWGGMDSGEAFRCVCGLAAGYLSRPFFKVEQLLWPLYDWGLRIIAPGAVYEVSASVEESTATLSRLGVAVAVCSFLPQLLWGWDSSSCLQFVLPLAGGWLLFDVMYMAALLAKLNK